MVWHLNTVAKHGKITWSFYYRDCKKIPVWLAANSREGSTIEGRYECLGSSGCFSVQLENIFNVLVIASDGQYLLWSLLF